MLYYPVGFFFSPVTCVATVMRKNESTMFCYLFVRLHFESSTSDLCWCLCPGYSGFDGYNGFNNYCFGNGMFDDRVRGERGGRGEVFRRNSYSLWHVDWLNLSFGILTEKLKFFPIINLILTSVQYVFSLWQIFGANIKVSASEHLNFLLKIWPDRISTGDFYNLCL